MPKLSKIHVVAMVLVLVSGFVFANGNQESTSSTGKTKLTFWTFQNAHAEFMQDAAKSWTAKNP